MRTDTHYRLYMPPLHEIRATRAVPDRFLNLIAVRCSSFGWYHSNILINCYQQFFYRNTYNGKENVTGKSKYVWIVSTLTVAALRP